MQKTILLVFFLTIFGAYFARAQDYAPFPPDDPNFPSDSSELDNPTPSFLAWKHDIDFSLHATAYAEAAMDCGFKSPAWFELIQQGEQNTYNREVLLKNLPLPSDLSLVSSYTDTISSEIMAEYSQTSSNCDKLKSRGVMPVLNRIAAQLLGD
ncbi:hypothetical protein GCM10010909_26560 [Acidocella aquatica]|uniref:Uncharacterized protein n=1 Tax=Acidocella aquatica TaxID=1922313 RepID=A0ABQ6A697_9PROT|nr:hypothetical protein [Acidocella aquatica]GLR67975.1 hypothetical protein GCM10010909_26560 [Acidocella aquatica]